MTKEKTKGIHEKIFNIQQKVAWIQKLGYNTFHKYKYAFEVDIINEIKPLLGEERLILLNSGIGMKIRIIKVEKEKKKILASVKIKYTLIDIDSKEKEVGVGYGAGIDAGDKGIYKALTGAMKYYLTKTFLIATGEDPEKSSKSKKETTAEIFERAKQIIKNTRSIDGLMGYVQNVKDSKKYNKTQKAELQKLITARSKEVDSKK